MGRGVMMDCGVDSRGRKQNAAGGTCAPEALQFGGASRAGNDGVGGRAVGVQWHSADRGHDAGW